LNKNVFNDRLKLAVHLVALSSQGNLFQLEMWIWSKMMKVNWKENRTNEFRNKECNKKQTEKLDRSCASRKLT